MTVGKRIKELRKEKGLTQQNLAELLKITKGSICKYEKGIHEPNIDTLNLLTQIFSCSMDYLLGKTDLKDNKIKNEYMAIVEYAKNKNISPEKLDKIIKALLND
jgi:transcriptional regulator with XRE-family HTH domain